MFKRRQKKENNRGSGLKIGQRRFVLSVTIPMVLYMSIGLFTLLWAFILMFFKYSPARAGGPFLGLGGSNPFVGLQHFQNMFTGVSLEARQFRISLVNTLIFAFVVLAVNLAITLPLAALIEFVNSRLQKYLSHGVFFTCIDSICRCSADVGIYV